MERAETFEGLRPLLFSIAYRILGSVGEAEDAVQEAWLRFERSQAEPRSPKAYLSAVVTRIAIDVLRSARVRREEYVGAWLPEPVLEDPYADPERAAELADSLSTAALLLLERLSPLERAVFVLREVFGFEFGEVAAAVGRSEAACRQLAARARRHMAEGRARYAADDAARGELAERFVEAFRAGDVQSLAALLASDARLVADSGGKAPQWRPSFTGARQVTAVLAELAALFDAARCTVECRRLNGQPGAIFHDRDGRVVNTWSLDILDGQIQTIRTVSNPDKLRHLGPVADAQAVFEDAARERRSAAAAQDG
ncbi:RNA polymerase sigma-70 factor [Glycomyces terrestris]|uniref:RNA polymerase sigma-70 factor n=1 Tax=Glycomyces terrestris TaxID=2493553 RepID=A0A426V389_9ACTN|nr:RNA polymerase sigma-70 factor [Glycomyces terrestris]RRS01369.1 RNA polymerase sigma-70 factor [Glycomyces terrestris]